ncbi:UNVERIFIED_CONTAM: hypothetical protein FKN15_048604 [Acipenser sinensis]
MLPLPQAQRVGRTMRFHSSWDESSSISSGLSDASDNLSSEEFNASSSLNSLPTTPTGSRRNSAIVVHCFCPLYHLSSSTPRITRSNSIPAHDAAFELYGGASQVGSTLSLAERPKGMTRSGSFRDPVDDVHGSVLSLHSPRLCAVPGIQCLIQLLLIHGSVLSLASSASSNYSSAEERMQGEQIRKLRRELESSQEKVASLTNQLSANANLVAAFEQSLVNMTSRLQSLSVCSEQKDSELSDLRETIEVMKTKNVEAQAVIHVALNNPDITPKELRIKRQNSSDSISSLNSITSHSSIGSCKDNDAKKKKKKSWLRSSFNKAFSIKKGPKSASSYSDIEEIATPDSSAPSSPKLSHEGGDNPPLSLKSSTSTFSSMTVESLKAENDQLKTGTGPNTSPAPSPAPPSSISQPQGLSSLLSASPRQSMALSLTQSFTLSLNECTDTEDNSRLRILVRVSDQDVFNDDIKQQDFFIGSVKVNAKTEWDTLDAAVCQTFKDYIAKVDPASSLGLSPDSIYCYSISQGRRVLGAESPELVPSRYMGRGTSCIAVTLKGLKEKCVDSLVFETLIPKPMMQHYISLLLKHRRLILSGPSGTGKTYLTCRLAEYLVERSGRAGTEDIAITYNMHERLLLKHRRLILSGPSGTGKTYLTCRLAEYLVERSGRAGTEDIAITYNMHERSCKARRAAGHTADLQLFLSNLANRIDRETSSGEVPLVIILDDLSDSGSISELVNGALTCKYHKCPYIIGTTNQPVKMTPNHGLHLSFRYVPVLLHRETGRYFTALSRMVTFSNNVEPANGFLVRYLHRKLMETESDCSANNEDLLRVLDWVPKLWYHLHTFLEKHSTSDFLIGPCFFLSCPVTVEEFRCWFIELWNHSIIPYLQEGAKDGIKVHGQKAVWEDPVEWVRGTLPWPSAQQDQAKLFHLPPPSVGPIGAGQPSEERAMKETTPSSLDSDPLMAMLLKLQEAANYIESPDRESVLDPSLQSTH